MAAYRRVYDSRHRQADCQEPGSAPDPTLGNRVRATCKVYDECSAVRRTGAVRSSVELVSGPAGAAETAVSVAADVVTRVVVATLVNV